MAIKSGQDLNRSQFAIFAGVAPTTVDAYIRAGMPSSKQGRAVTINSKEAIEWLQEKAKAEVSRATADTPDAEIRRRRELAEMERAERQNALEGGEVARIDEMSELWSEQVARITSKLDAIPSRFGPSVAYACAALTENSTPELIEEMRIAAEAKLQEAADELRDDLANGAALPDDADGQEEPLPNAA